MMNTIKHKHILIFVIIFVVIAGAFSIVKVRAMNNQNSAVVVANIYNISPGSTPNTVSFTAAIVSGDFYDNFGLEIPVSSSVQEMNRSLRAVLENTTFYGNHILNKNDTLILFGGLEKL